MGEPKDTNALLERLRELTEKVMSDADEMDDESLATALMDLAETFGDLDEALSGGAELPKGWAR